MRRAHGARFAALGVKTRYYTPDLHLGAMHDALPQFILDLLD